MIKYLLIGALTACLAACQSGSEVDSSNEIQETSQTIQAETPELAAEDHQEFYENGALKMEGQMLNGKRHGRWVAYYPTGIKWSETTFDRGVKSGATKSYYKNGMMHYSGQYKNDEKAGIWNFYNEDGVLEKTVDVSKKGVENSAE